MINTIVYFCLYGLVALMLAGCQTGANDDAGGGKALVGAVVSNGSVTDHLASSSQNIDSAVKAMGIGNAVVTALLQQALAENAAASAANAVVESSIVGKGGLNEQIKKLQGEVTSLEASNGSQAKKLGLWFDLVGGVGLVAACVLVYLATTYLGTSGRVIGIAVGIGGGGALCVGLLLPFLAAVVPWVAGSVVVLALGLGAYYLWSHRVALVEYSSKAVGTLLTAKTAQIVTAAAQSTVSPDMRGVGLPIITQA